MLTTVWGPSMWHYLHTMSFNYPVKPKISDKLNYMRFMKSLKHVLPCYYCRINLRKNFKYLPLTMKCMKNRETFSLYVYNLHEHINKMLGKTSNLTYDDVREKDMNIFVRDVHKKMLRIKFLNIKKLQKQRKRNVDVHSHYMVKNQNVL